jgi:predicted ATPase
MIPRQFLLSAKLRREKIKSFDSYPFSLPVVKNPESLAFHPNVTSASVGSNTGKPITIG